jgi:hypothetical protein
VGEKSIKTNGKLFVRFSIIYIGFYYSCLIIFSLNGWDTVVINNALALFGDAIFVVFLINNVGSSEGKIKHFWRFLLAAGMSYTFGDAIWMFNEVLLSKEVLFPSIADFFYLLWPVFSISGLWYILKVMVKKESALYLLFNVLIFITVLFIISWRLLIYPVIQDSENSIIAIIISIAYPLSDLGLVFAALTLTMMKTEIRINIKRIIYGFFLMALADTIYMFQANWDSYLSGTFLDPLWPAAFFIIASAGWNANSEKPNLMTQFLQKKSEKFRLEEKLNIGIPLLAMIFMIFALSLGNHFSIVMIGYLIANSLLILRQNFALKENDQLTAEIEQMKQHLLFKKDNLQNRFESLMAEHQTTEELARKDYLTGAYNRRFMDNFKRSLNSEFRGADSGFSVLVADIDHFKRINDELDMFLEMKY